MTIKAKDSKQHLRKQLEALTERLEWLETQVQDNQMRSEVIWFINSRYKSKFFKGEEDE
tara:strand:+ start:842 stop:1018 length:177 start_codon:yes stop_codon:yes gene_type:complete